MTRPHSDPAKPDCPATIAAVCAFQLKQQERQLSELAKLMMETNTRLAKIEPWLQSLAGHDDDHERRLKNLELKEAANSGRASILAIVWSSLVTAAGALLSWHLKN